MNSTATDDQTLKDDTSELDTPKAPCVKGATGYAIVWKPTEKSIAYLDVKFNVTWDYTPAVTSKPDYVDVYVQSQKPGSKVTWSTQVASKVPAEPRWFFWKPTALAEGPYKLMVVPNGKKLAGVRADSLPCFENGEAEPGVSQRFNIMKLTNTGNDLSVTAGDDSDVFSSAVRLADQRVLLYWGIVVIILYYCCK